MIRLIMAADYDDMSRRAANFIGAQITLKPDSVLGLATGGTPVGIYRQLVTDYEIGLLDFSQVRTVNLDEYRGISPANPQSYYYYMKEKLFSRVNLSPSNTAIPRDLPGGEEESCRSYDALLDSWGRVDLQLLGIGANGHIGFNEPSDRFSKGTYCVTLAASTIHANARFFPSEADVPQKAYTMGIRSIMSARRILLAASGSGKAEILRKAFEGPITPQVPASVLQLHPDVTVIGDEAAFSEIRVPAGGME